MPRAAALIIGTEILTGKFDDANGPFLIRRLRELGTDLGRIVVLDDEIDEIAAEIARATVEFDFVFTTGGVGPTHDDVTLEAVAAGLGRELVLDDELAGLLDTFGLPRNAATLRMAMVPAGTEKVRSDVSRYPVLRCDNVWIFPGVPKLFRRKFETVAAHFTGIPLHTARLYITAHETDIAQDLTALALRYPDVDIGSYPRFTDEPFNVILTFESRDEGALQSVVSESRNVFPLWVDDAADEPVG